MKRKSFHIQFIFFQWNETNFIENFTEKKREISRSHGQSEDMCSLGWICRHEDDGQDKHNEKKY